LRTAVITAEATTIPKRDIVRARDALIPPRHDGDDIGR
jgi:hypothetical protein